MGDLSVVVRLHGDVVEDRVIEVERLVRLGEASGAVVHFPGADLAVVRLGRRLAVRGRTLEEGDALGLTLGAVEVHIEHTVRARMPSEWAGLWDRRFLAAALLVVAVGTWLDAAEVWLDEHPSGSALGVTHVRALLRGIEPSSRGTRALALPAARPVGSQDSPTVELADGPRHEPDDHLTGMAWAAWYAQLVPVDDDHEYEAEDRFAADPEDAWARRVLARAAYNADDPDTACWHYSWLVGRFPEDPSLRLRLARAEQRRGHHLAEIDQYEAILSIDPGQVEAMAGYAVALARLNRLDEAAAVLDQLQHSSPDSPMTDLAVAQLSAMAGLDRRALEAVEGAVGNRSALSDEGQLELRRSLAVDPVFRSLRRDPRLRSLIYRHLGAAGVRPMR